MRTPGAIKDVYAVWELPIAVLLPPLFALLAPLIRFALIQYRIRRIPLHRRVFSAAAVSLSFGAASVVFHLSARQFTGPGLSVGFHGSTLLLVVAAVAALQWAINTALVLPAVKASDPALRIRDLLLQREQVQNDVVELCVAVLVVLGIAITPLTIIFSLPFVTLLQRSVRHAQLVNASRIDSKTGLLNAGTWEREAASEVARAVRTRTPLALVLIDIDHFKVVNDLHGHLAGDRALRAIAHTFQIFLRGYDLAGRFGGEEFALLLPQTSAPDARQIAERVRTHIAAMPISVDDDPAYRATTGYCLGRGSCTRCELGEDNWQPAHRLAGRRGQRAVPGQARGPQPGVDGDRHGHRGGRPGGTDQSADVSVNHR